MNKDGLGWYFNPDDGNGTISIKNGLTNATLKNFNVDFGTKIMHNFFTTFPMEIPGDPVVNLSPISILVFPNPSRDITRFSIDLTADQPSQINIYDAAGKLVFEKQANGYYEEFNLQQLSPGMYTAMVVQGSKVGSKKFVVK